MSSSRPHGFTALLLASAVALTACGPVQAADDQAAGDQAREPASVELADGGGPGVITLSEAAEDRLGVETAPVAAAAGGSVVPYSAVVYEADGSSWVFVRTAPSTYQRAAVAIGSIAGDQVAVTAGPPVGTEVVTVGAAELVGVEIGIDGEE